MSAVTYGEYHYLKFIDVHMVNGEFVPIHEAVVNSQQCPKRMGRNSAVAYYTQKFRKYFRVLEPFVFDSIDDKFDYYEALKTRKQLIGA